MSLYLWILLDSQTRVTWTKYLTLAILNYVCITVQFNHNKHQGEISCDHKYGTVIGKVLLANT